MGRRGGKETGLAEGFLARQVCFFLLLVPFEASRRRLRISSAGRCCCWTSLAAASGFPAAAVLAQWLVGLAASSSRVSPEGL